MAACATAVRLIPQSRLNPRNGPEKRIDPGIPPDDVLVESAKTGEAGAFARLMERYERFCLSKAYSILRNRSDAEDDVQAAWVQAWTHLGSYECQGSFCAWLSRIVSNQCLMRLRNAKLMPVMSVDQVFESEGSFRLEVIDQRASPEDMMGDIEVSRVLTNEVRGLPPLLREVLVMRDLHNVDMAEIATQLGISVAAAKSRLMRARVELRQRLVKHHGAKGGGTLLQKSGRHKTAYVQAG
jgi:RNA polymerase sigma-70 factor, ECF subfamily